MSNGSAVVQIVQPDKVPESENWMGYLKKDDKVLYVQKLEARLERGGARNVFEYAKDKNKTPKKFACFIEDVRCDKVKLEPMRTRNPAFRLLADESNRVLSYLATED